MHLKRLDSQQSQLLENVQEHSLCIAGTFNILQTTDLECPTSCYVKQYKCNSHHFGLYHNNLVLEGQFSIFNHCVCNICNLSLILFSVKCSQGQKKYLATINRITSKLMKMLCKALTNDLSNEQNTYILHLLVKNYI